MSSCPERCAVELGAHHQRQCQNTDIELYVHGGDGRKYPVCVHCWKKYADRPAREFHTRLNRRRAVVAPGSPYSHGPGIE